MNYTVNVIKMKTAMFNIYIVTNQVSSFATSTEAFDIPGLSSEVLVSTSGKIAGRSSFFLHVYMANTKLMHATQTTIHVVHDTQSLSGVPDAISANTNTCSHSEPLVPLRHSHFIYPLGAM